MPGDQGQYNEYGTHSLTGQDSEETHKYRNVRVEPDIRGLRVANWVWDLDNLEWVRMSQDMVDLTDVETMLKNDWYHDAIIDWDSDGRFEYLGLNPTMNAAVSGTNWLIFKIEYNSDYNINRVRSRTGAWDTRTASWS